jgi:hypothetical protein
MRSSLLATSLVTLLSLCCAAPTTTPTPPQQHAMVEFSFDSLSPASVKLTAGGNVEFVNRGEDMTGVVVLPAETAAGLACGERVGPMFRKTDAGLASLPIDDADESRVQLPCSLAPGTYSYEIWIFGAGLGEVVEGALKKLPGKIIVE